VVAADENLLEIVAFDRLANTPPTAAGTDPRRVVGGASTKVEFVCGLYVDQESGEVYGINNDTENTLVVFSRDKAGDVPPTRELKTPHGTFGLAVDEKHREIFLTVQHDSAVVVYRKSARGEEPPVRVLHGNRTGLADPHGVAVDSANGQIFVANHGSVADRDALGWFEGRTIPGTGRFLPSSITVHARDAEGNAPPLRVISGPKTRLNWPAGLVFDERRRELLVANDMEHSILVFAADAEGDVAPVRVLEGPKTGMKHPTGLFLDTKNDELWVANFGNHSLTVFKSTAAGDAAPVRTIRSAPAGSAALMIGNPGAVAYDTKREELLVPN
jgi:DNA-binding beta-propeller fold protein YncE